MNKMMTPTRPLSEALSNPDIYKTPDSELDGLINAGKKRKIFLQGASTTPTENNLDILSLFNELKIGQDTQFSHFAKMESDINTVMSQNRKILSSHDEMKKTMSEIVQEQKNLKKRVEILEQRESEAEDMKKQMEIMERKIKDSSVEIRNVQVENNGQSLTDVIKTIHRTLNVSYDNRDIRNIYYLPAKVNQHKPILVEYNSTQKKLELLNALKEYNTKNKEKLNSSNIGLSGEKKNIYINEMLTRKAKKLHYLARESTKTNGWKFCWTARGRVFIRKTEGSPAIEIKEERQLEALETNTAGLSPQ